MKVNFGLSENRDAGLVRNGQSSQLARSEHHNIALQSIERHNFDSSNAYL
jgi:hypothetical protein